MFLDNERVALIRKKHPKWQEGCLNGIGGKINDGEFPDAAMQREFKEETGLDTSHVGWYKFCVMGNSLFDCKCYTAHCSLHEWEAIATQTDEEVVKLPISKIKQHKCISNVPWLVEMALNGLNHDFEAEVRYPFEKE
jgi:8-oxo-dGTP diphosphatase